MTASEKRLGANHIKNHNQYVKETRRMYQAALKAQIVPVINAIPEHTQEWVLNHLDELVRERPIRLAFRNAYGIIAIKAGQTVLDEIRGQLEQKAGIFEAEFYSGIWKTLVQVFVQDNAGERISRITNTTRERVRTALINAVEEGGGAYDRAKAIQALTDNQFTYDRALIIARTEGTTAASVGHNIAADSLSDRLNVAMGKKWIPIHDNRTRNAHLAMEKYPQIPKDRPFFVGYENMDYPGDQNASAANVINCRCRVSYSILRDANGRPLPKDSVLVGAYANM